VQIQSGAGKASTQRHAQAPLILDGADHAFYHAFLKSLARQVRYLRRTISDTRDGYPRLLAAIALCFAGLCMSGEIRLLRMAGRRLAFELNRQILPDGGHVSRNPDVLIELLLDLLPLRQSFEARSVPTPQALLNAIDRMMPMLRFFRHGDGAFAQFNGTASSATDVMATILAYDEALGQPVSSAAYSGYERVEAGPSLLLVDAGPPPPIAFSERAHAGTLSFEFSSGGQRTDGCCRHGEPGRCLHGDVFPLSFRSSEPTMAMDGVTGWPVGLTPRTGSDRSPGCRAARSSQLRHLACLAHVCVACEV
jgi:uncharacterized heparinase superfamily protein